MPTLHHDICICGLKLFPVNVAQERGVVPVNINIHNVSNVVVVWKWVAKSEPEYICVMMRLVPFPHVKYIPVLWFIGCAILYAKISPNNE